MIAMYTNQKLPFPQAQQRVDVEAFRDCGVAPNWPADSGVARDLELAKEQGQ